MFRSITATRALRKVSRGVERDWTGTDILQAAVGAQKRNLSIHEYQSVQLLNSVGKADT